jgi:hypothetical protein
MKNFRAVATSVSLAALLVAGPISANADTKDVIGGIVAGMIASGIADASSTDSTRSRTSSDTQRVRVNPSEDTLKVQLALTYFGFDAGPSDGVSGKKTRAAISEYQILLGYQPTGQLTAFEKQFLLDTHVQAQQSVSASSTSNTANIPTRLVLTDRRDKMFPTQVTQPVTETVVTQSVNVGTETTFAEPGLGAKADAESLDKLVVAYQDVQNQISLLQIMLEHQMAKEATPSKALIVQAIDEAIAKYEAVTSEMENTAQRQYDTPIYPDNSNRTVTALKASEIFPRIPYYIPGTTEIGEMWVVPAVTDDGYLRFMLNFMDPEAEFGRIREAVELEAGELSEVAAALKKVERWSDQAQKAEVRRNFQKRAFCVPVADCEEKKPGNSSTEVMFALYEDGSTAAKIQRNKGNFTSGYNLSVKSAMLLVGYIDYMSDVGAREFNAGSMTDEELDAMFK